jgi:hypothetical protein
MQLLPHMPNSATVRIFAASQSIESQKAAVVRSCLDAFCAQWRSHEQSVAGSWAILHDRFVVVAADESQTHLSGCSKDSVVKTMRAIESQIGLEFIGPAYVIWREGKDIRTAPRSDFADLAQKGAVGPETVVFDQTVATLGDLREGRWETAAKNSWHAQAFDFVAR